MTSSRALAPISTLPFLDQPLHGRVDQRLELGDGVAVDLEVPAERVAHLGLLPFPAAVFAEHEHASLPPPARRPATPARGSTSWGGRDACSCSANTAAALETPLLQGALEQRLREGT